MINLNTFKFSFPQTRNNNKASSCTFNAPKLTPLAFDTISFTSNRAKLNQSLLDSFDNKEVCEQVALNAKPAENYLRGVLNTTFRKYVNTKDNQDGTIAEIVARIKSPDSIREKVANELEYAIVEDRSKIFCPTDSEDIKKVIGDIVGARIVLRNSDVQNTKKIIDDIITLVDEGKLKITKIENFEPSGLEEQYKYFNYEDLVRLQEAANKNRAPKDSIVKLKQLPKASGYMALHIDVDLSNDEKYSVANNAYKGEIQIVGYDVEKLKDVEDLCYKRKQGKNIKGAHVAYDAFKRYFSKYMSLDDKYPNLSANFGEYTKRAYLYQRKKAPLVTYKNKNKYQLPTIEQCGMTGKIPPELDFNKLEAIKQCSDELYRLTRSI